MLRVWHLFPCLCFPQVDQWTPENKNFSIFQWLAHDGCYDLDSNCPCPQSSCFESLVHPLPCIEMAILGFVETVGMGFTGESSSLGVLIWSISEPIHSSQISLLCVQPQKGLKQQSSDHRHEPLKPWSKIHPFFSLVSVTSSVRMMESLTGWLCSQRWT